MKDKKTLKEIFAEARRAGADAPGIAHDPEALEDLKAVVEGRGDVEAAFEIQEQIDRLRKHTKEEILEILDRDHVYYSANRLSVTALYDWKDVRKDMDSMLAGEDRERIVPCSWSVCRESDEIDSIELYDADRPFTLHLPMDSFGTAEEAVNRFLDLYEVEETGLDTSNRCGTCKHFDGGCDFVEVKHLITKDAIGCKHYECKEE